MLVSKKFLFYIILSNFFNRIYTNYENWIISPIEQNYNIKKNLELDLINFSIEYNMFFEGLNLCACFILNNLYIKKIRFNNFNFFISYKIYTNEFEYFNFNLNILNIFSFNKKVLKDIVVKAEFYNIFMSKYFNFSIDLFVLNQQFFIYYYGFIAKKKIKIYSKFNLIKIVNIIKGKNNYIKERKNDIDKIKDAISFYDAIYNENEQKIKFSLNKKNNLQEETFSIEEFFEKSEKLKKRINKQYKLLVNKYHPDKNNDNCQFQKLGFLHEYINNI